MDKFSFIKKAFNLSLDTTPLNCNAICAMTGEMITTGYQTSKIISDASADLADTFPYGGDWLSEDAAILFKASTVLRGNFLALEGQGLRPLISKESSIAENRPCWRDLIMEMTLDIPTVAIISDESKRRLWPNAKLSYFGKNWRPYFNGTPYKNKQIQAPPVQRNLKINVTLLREILTLIEHCYNLGFSKLAIAQGLLSASITLDLGLKEVKNLDNSLSKYRNCDEFILAIFIAQKSEVIETVIETKTEIKESCLQQTLW